MSITVEHLEFAYRTRPVLQDVSFCAEKGRLLAVLGPNGAGKTTLFRCVLGLLRGYQGRILVDGTEARTLSARELAHRIAYIPQIHGEAFAYSALEMVLMGTTHSLSLIHILDEIGAFFITPCPAKMASIHSGQSSYVDGAIAIQDIYGLLSSQLRQPVPETLKKKRHASWQGVNWATYGGECAALHKSNTLSVDGIHNVIYVLEEIENGKLDDLEFFEGSACEGGCVGGPLVLSLIHIWVSTY